MAPPIFLLMSMLQLQGIRKKYNHQLVLDIPEWQIDTGIYWIQGENGAGKSTLFRMLAGILGFEGEIILNDTLSLRKHPVQYRRQLTLAEAEPLYPSFLTPRNLISFIAETRLSTTAQADTLIQKMGIHTFLDHPFSTCSSGMVKKVSLLLAFLGNPSLIILDEPLITIDKETRQLLYELIIERSKNGTGFLLSSHQLFDRQEIQVKASYEIKNHTLNEIQTAW